MTERATDHADGQTTPQSLKWSELDDLAPHYVSELHGSYLRGLVEGIEKGSATNIALSGPYGSGKSSILDGLVSRYKSQIVQISFATVRSVAHVSSSSADVESNTPKETRQPGMLVSANDLQKEIVKQILYVEDPARTPASRFPRVARFQWVRGIAVAIATGLAAVAIQWLIAIVIALSQGGLKMIWAPEAYLPTFFAVGLLTLFVLRMTNGRWGISDLTAGPAKLTLSDKKGSYFDDYLDEIVYFFQASEKRIVILEDMDRFNNVEVFEDLRSLNVLLNHAAQLDSARMSSRATRLRRRVWGKSSKKIPFDPSQDHVYESFSNGPIVFVYAIRDSLLSTKVQATEDVRHDPFGRTKFFDLIIPVVPFVTQQNARGALKAELDLLKVEHDSENTCSSVPSDGIVRLIAQYFPDQRQIRNIRNEFSMYREHLLQPGYHPAELTPDRLLALVLYKNLEVADFERIRLGEGQLHQVLRLSRDLVRTNLERITTRLNGPPDTILQKRAEEVGARVEAGAAALGLQFQKQIPQSRYGTSYSPMTSAELGNLQFWRQVVTGSHACYLNGKAIQRNEIETGFGVSLGFADSDPALMDESERHQLEIDRTFLEQATWSKLWASPHFGLSSPSETEIVEIPPAKKTDVANRSFAQIVFDVLGEGLAADLIAEDHLTQNFALLSSSFSDLFLGLEAQDFVTRVMEQPGRRPLDFISQSATKEVIAEKGEVILERAGMVNIHVLNYLLVEQCVAVPRVVGQLRNWSNHDHTFLRDFFERYGNEAPLDPLFRMVAYLVGMAPGAVEFFAVEEGIPEEKRCALFDTAISHVRIGALPDVIARSGAVKQFARTMQSELKSLSEEGEIGARSAHCLAQLGIRLNDVVPLSKTVRDVLVPRGMFAMTMPNLQVLIGQETYSWVSLERLRAHADVYHSTLPRISEYLELRMGDIQGATASSPEALSAILTELNEHFVDVSELIDILRHVTSRSEQGATVEEIIDLKGPVQDALLFEQRAAPTTGNLLARFVSAGEFTDSLASAIHDNPLPTIDDESIDLSELANKAVEASQRHPELLTADIISQFVTGAAAQITLLPDSLLEAEDTVAIRMIDEGRVDITAMRTAIVGLAPEITWKVREALLAREPVPDLNQLISMVPAEDLRSFLSSDRIPDAVRMAIPQMLDTLLTGTQRTPNADAIARYLASKNVPTEFDTVLRLARAQAKPTTTIELLLRDPAITGFTADPVTALQAFGGRYAAIVDGTPKSPTFPNDAAHQNLIFRLAGIKLIKRLRPAKDGSLRVSRNQSTP